MARELGSRDELNTALFSVDEKVICEYFKRGQLWSLGVSPVLLAAATLQAMLRGSPTTHCHCYSQAVELLEYIHSECPPLGKEEAEQYIDLLVEFKTRAVLYELFEEVVVTDELRENVLTKYLGKTSCDQQTQGHITYTTTEEYSQLLHAYARHGLKKMLASDKMCEDFRRTHFFNSENSKVNSSLLTYLTRYLSVVYEHLRETEVSVRTFSNSCEVDYIEGQRDETLEEISKSSAGNQAARVASHGSRRRGRLKSREVKQRANRGDPAANATDSTANTSAEEMTDERGVVHGGHYNLRRHCRRDRGSETDEGKRGGSKDQGRQPRRPRGEGEEEEGGFASNIVSEDFNSAPQLTPNRVTPRGGEKTPEVPHASATRSNVRISTRRHREGWKMDQPESPIREQQEDRTLLDSQLTQQTEEEDRLSDGEETRAMGQRYQLRQKQPKPSTARAGPPEQVAGVTSRARTVGKKHKKSASSEQSDSSTAAAVVVLEPARAPLASKHAHHKPRPKRRIVFRKSGPSSEEEEEEIAVSDGGPGKRGRQKTKDSPGRVGSSSVRGRSKRKQVTPRRLSGNTREKLMSRVHFSQSTSEGEGSTTTTTTAVTVTAATRGETSSGSSKHHDKSMTRSDKGSPNRDTKCASSTHSRSVGTQSSDSSSECEMTPILRHLLRSGSETPRQEQLTRDTPTSTGRSARRVVDLTDSNVEQSQPTSQWDYVAVQSAAAAEAHSDEKEAKTPTLPRMKSPSTRDQPHSHRKRLSDMESDCEQVCSSEELSLATPPVRTRRAREQSGGGGGGGDKLSVVSESSPGSSSPVQIQPALLSINNLRKR